MFDLPPELLAAIIDAPDDDAPRLVAADWLEEHDDADSARWIRLQIDFDRPPGGRGKAEATERRVELRRLRDRNLSRWLGPLLAVHAADPSQVRWTRGFVNAVRQRFEWDPSLLPALARHTPLLEELDISYGQRLAADDLAHLGGLPLLGRLRVDGIMGTPGERTVAALARLTHLRTLEIRPTWGDAFENAFCAARLAWLDGLPEAERARAVASMLVCDGEFFHVYLGVGFPQDGAHQIELAARLPSLRRLEAYLADRREPDLPSDAFAGLRTLSAHGDLRPFLARVRPPGLRVAALSSDDPAGDREAIADWLRGTPELRSLSIDLDADPGPAGDPPTLPALPELRTLRLPFLRMTGRPWLDPFRPLPELRELRYAAFGWVDAADPESPGPSAVHPRLRLSHGLERMERGPDGQWWCLPPDSTWGQAQVRLVTVPGVASLRLPTDLGEPAEVSPGRWEWCEWGDALDAELPNPNGPAVLVLEAAPPGGDVGHWADWQPDHGGRSVGSAVWGTPVATFLLTLTVGGGRLLPWKQWWADAVASFAPAS